MQPAALVPPQRDRRGLNTLLTAYAVFSVIRRPSCAGFFWCFWIFEAGFSGVFCDSLRRIERGCFFRQVVNIEFGFEI